MPWQSRSISSPSGIFSIFAVVVRLSQTRCSGARALALLALALLALALLALSLVHSGGVWLRALQVDPIALFQVRLRASWTLALSALSVARSHVWALAPGARSHLRALAQPL